MIHLIRKGMLITMVVITAASCSSDGSSATANHSATSAGFRALQQGGFVESSASVTPSTANLALGNAPANMPSHARYNQYVNCVTSNNHSFMSQSAVPFSALRDNALSSDPGQAASLLLFTTTTYTPPGAPELSSQSLSWRHLMQSVLLTCCAQQADTSMPLGPTSYVPNFMGALGLGYAVRDYVTYILAHYPFPKELILTTLQARRASGDANLTDGWYNALVTAVNSYSGSSLTLERLSSLSIEASRDNALNHFSHNVQLIRLAKLFRIANLEESCGTNPTYLIDLERINDSDVRNRIEAVRSRVYCQSPTGLVANLVNAALLPNAQGQSACTIINRSQSNVRALTVDEHQRFSSCTQSRARNFLSSHGADASIAAFMGEYDTCCARVSGQIRRTLRVLNVPNTSHQFVANIPSLVIHNGSGARSVQSSCQPSETAEACLSRKMEALVSMLGACTSYSASNTNCIRTNMSNERALLTMVHDTPSHEDAQLVINILSDSCVKLVN